MTAAPCLPLPPDADDTGALEITMFDTASPEEAGHAVLAPQAPDPAADDALAPAPAALRRAPLRRVDADEARLWTCLGAGRRIALRLQPGSEPAWCDIQVPDRHEVAPVAPGHDPSQPQPPGLVSLVGPSGRLWIEDGAAFLHALTGVSLDAGEGPVDADARAAWLDTRQWLAGAASAALSGTGWPARDHVALADAEPGAQTLHAPPSADGRAPLRRLRLQLRTEDHVFTTHGWSEDAAWVDRLQDAMSLPGPVRLDAAAVQAAVVVARHRLRRGALRALRPGSLIRPMHTWSLDGRGAWRLGALRWHARLTAQGLELEQMMDDTAYDTTDTFNDPTPEDVGAFDAAGDVDTVGAGSDATTGVGPASGLLDELPITLQFEAGQVRLTVAEAARLAPGAVLGLQATPGPAQVVIRAGGVALGTGELVEVDGRLAVQILRWTGAAGTGVAP